MTPIKMCVVAHQVVGRPSDLDGGHPYNVVLSTWQNRQRPTTGPGVLVRQSHIKNLCGTVHVSTTHVCCRTSNKALSHNLSHCPPSHDSRTPVQIRTWKPLVHISTCAFLRLVLVQICTHYTSSSLLKKNGYNHVCVQFATFLYNQF